MWIPISERLPEGEALIFGTWRNNESGMDVGRCYIRSDNSVVWSISGSSGFNVGNKVTHWMPLPLPPEE
jgi:hypothetical protein